MYTPYPRITTGNPFTVLDAPPGKNPLGTLYAPPINQALPLTAAGIGLPPVLKYVYYNPTASVTPVAAPAPVYWKDETFTTVTPTSTEAMNGAGTSITIANNFIAGWLLPNTTSITGLVAVGTATAPSGLNGSDVWIQIGGFLAGAWVPTGTAAGDTLQGTVTPFLAAHTGAGAAPIGPILGRAVTAAVAVTGGFTADILVGNFGLFTGS